MGKRIFQPLTQSEEAQVELDIYNDQPIRYYQRSEKEDILDTNRQEMFLQRVLLPDEAYIIMKDKPEFVYTSKARCFNTKTFRQISGTFTATRLFHMCNQFTFKAKETLEEMGWDYDLDVIKSDYVKYGWKYNKTHAYKRTSGKNRL